MPFLRSRTFYIVLAVLAVNIALFAFGFYATFLRGLPDFQTAEDYEPFLTSVVYDRDGRPIGEYFEERRRLVPFDEIPRHVVYAFVAGEDGTFFEHTGIDYVSILRAAWVNLRAGGAIRQGGSTITQQVAKSLLSSERSYQRKIKDMLLARRMEAKLSKEDILYLYLNQIYLGSGAYGVAEATRRYFGKELIDITVSEAAVLAGLPKAPSSYSPIRHPEKAEQRRRYVLQRMFEDGFIDRATYEESLAEETVLTRPPEYLDYDPARYFTEEVRRYLVELIGEEALNRGGLRIETTMDLELQRAAVEAVRHGLTNLDRRQGYRGPLRQVAPEEIEATILALGEANGLIEEPEEPAPEAESEEATPRSLPLDEVFEGVVTQVDEAEKRAYVSFAPDLSHPLLLETVSWARKPDPRRRPRPVKSISKIVQVGDVARFTLREAPALKGEDPEAERPPVLDLDQVPEAQGGLVSMEVDTGEVLAMVGGYDYYENQFNRATQAMRQPGSALKPLIYAAALQKGYTPASVINDTAVVYQNEDGSIWKPKNYTPYFHGPITLREALVRSYNTATIRLFRDVGTRNVIEYLRHLGIQAPLAADLSLALGSSSLTLLELVRAYAVFPAGGRRVIPRFIHRVSDRFGNVLYEDLELGNLESSQAPPADASEPEPTPAAANLEPGEDAEVGEGVLPPGQLISATEAYLATDLVRAIVVDPHGTGWRARQLKRHVGGKTGTTNQQADAWFVGFSPDVVTGVWVGMDVRRLLGKGETGSRAASPIWVEYMGKALASRPDRDFPIPPGIIFARVDRKTGLLASESSGESYFQAFIEGTEPTESAETAEPLRLDDF